MTAPPREPTPKMIDAALSVGTGIYIAERTWRAMYDAAPAPSADRSTLRDRLAKVDWRALIEKGDDIPSCPHGVMAGNCGACNPPAAQPAEPTATDDLERWGNADTDEVGRKSGWHQRADGYWTPWHIADAKVKRQAREIARWNELHRVVAEELDCDAETWPDHRNAPLAIGATFVLIKQRAERAERERDELRAARIAYASEFPTNTDGEPDTGSIHANIRALKAERDALREQLHLRTCERDEAQACITTSADTIAALRECVKAADAMYALTEHTGGVSDCAKCNVADDYLAARAKVKP